MNYVGEDPGGCHIVEFGPDGDNFLDTTVSHQPVVVDPDAKQWLYENATSPEGWPRYALRYGASLDKAELPFYHVFSIKFYQKDHALMFLLRFK